ncbi:MAG: hypothetical protein H6706_25980 [Myxococcales bacterium]|nr:hypothetical protein [Myxococcales bacterium]
MGRPPLLLWCLAAPAVAGAADVGPAPPPGDVILHAETVLDATRWQGARATPEDRMDVRQRLGARARLGDPRLTLEVDLELGSDFGPEPDAWAATPDPRRAVVDVYAARLDARDVGGRLDLTLGRHLLYDVLGADALDGLTVALRAAPFLEVGASAGLATRRAWSGFGPDVFEPDGAGLSADPGGILRARVGTRGLRWLALQAGWTRQFDRQVQREDASALLRLGPDFLSLDAGLRYAVALHELADAHLGLASDAGPVRLGARWRRHRPSFSLDSIWNAFTRLPWDAAEAEAGADLGPWRLAADASVRWWPAGDATAQTPALAVPQTPAAEPDARSIEVGGSVARGLDAARPGAHLGLEGRAAEGYGGARRHVDVFTRLPLLYQLGRAPAWVQARLGAVALAELTAPAAWALLGAEWAPEETMTLEALGELYAGGPDPTRFRVLLRLRLEEWW